MLRQILLAGLPDHVARKIPKEELPEGADKKKFGYAYFTRLMEQPVFLHNMSVLKSRDPPEWVVYQEVYEVQVKLLFIPQLFFVWSLWKCSHIAFELILIYCGIFIFLILIENIFFRAKCI